MYNIKLMTLAQLDDVYQIEYQTFAPHHWTKSMFEYDILHNDYASYYLLYEAETVIGFIGIWHLLGEVQIINFAISPNKRGQGLGKLLLETILTQEVLKGAEYAFLEVRVSNQVAQNLYRQVGFDIIDIRKNYYEDNGEDAYIMQKIFSKGESV